MKTFDNDVKELEKYLRNELITQSQLNPKRVLNALSTYGTELDKLLNESDNNEEIDETYDAITPCNTTMLFELEAKDSNSNVSMEDNKVNDPTALICSNSLECDGAVASDGNPTLDTNITYYKMFSLKVIIYGNDSINLASKLVARFRSEATRNKLYADGVYLAEVSEQKTVNEFKNEMMWLRNDITIDIGIKQSIAQLTPEHTFADVDITILK